MRRFVALALAACSAPAPVPTHKVAPPAADVRDEDLARLPDDTWAAGAVDLTQLRTSLARRWAWQLAGEQSALIERCRDELAAGTRATLALAGSDGESIYAVVHGIDRTAILRCAVGEPIARDVPAASVPCDGYDAAVHALNGCPIPETQAAALAAAGERLRSDGAAACPAAEKVVEATRARITELGWTCRTRGDRHGQPGLVKGDAIVFGDERVEFLDEHTLVLAIASHGPLSLSSPARHERWFEATAKTIDRTRGAWAVANLKKLVDEPAAIAISGGIRGDLAVDLQIAHAPAKLTNEIFGIAQRAIDDKDFAGLKLALGCAPIATPARTPKLGACEAANQHLGSFTGNANLDVSGLLAERAARCVADNWPDDYVACVDKAADEHALAACFNVLSAADRERVEGGMNDACGQRAFAVHLAFPDARIEALKLANASFHVERDCRAPTDGPISLALFATPDGHYASACVQPDCVAWDLATGKPARPVMGDQPCVGPLHHTADVWTDAKGVCTDAEAGQRADLGVLKLKTPDAIAVSADNKRALAITKGTAQVWELPSGKPLGKLALAKGCTDATFLGDLVAVDCGAKSYLASPSGQHLAELGNMIVRPLPLADRSWALVARQGDRIDLYTGGGKKRTELAVPHHADQVAVATDGNTLAILYGGSGPDGASLAVVDAQQQLRMFQQPICPAAPAGH